MSGSIDQAFIESFAGNRRKIAFVTATGNFRYQEIGTLSEIVRCELTARVGDPASWNGGRPIVALVLDNGPWYVAALTGTLGTGCDAAPLEPRLSDRELTDTLKRLRPTLVLAASGRVQRTGYPVRGGALFPGCDLLIADPPMSTPTLAQCPHPVPSLIFHTSGTSGQAKPVRHRADSALSAIHALQRLRAEAITGIPADAPRLARILRRGGTRLIRQSFGHTSALTTFGFSTIGGHTFMAISLLNGDTIVVPRSLHPEYLLGEMRRRRITLMATTPAILGLMLKTFDPRRHDVSSLCVLGVGGGPTSAELVSTARRRLRCEVIVSYGTTEFGGSALSTMPGDRDADQGCNAQGTVVGRPLPGFEVRIVDPGDNPVPDGQSGELLCRRHDGEWVRTGDSAVRDQHGDVRILGRLDDMLLRDGMNIYPAEVETVLDAHNDVVRSAVVPVSGPSHDMRIRALVVPRPGQAPTAGELITYCGTRLAPFRVPDEICFVEELPRTLQGETRSPYLRLLANSGPENGSVP